MGLMSQARPFVGGVSQKPAQLRGSTRVADQVNAWSHPEMGLRRRPGAAFVATLGALPGNSRLHFFERSPSERYVIALSGQNGVSAWNLDTGAQSTVTVISGASNYLNCTDAVKDLRAITVGDTTFIVNRAKTVKQGTTKAPLQVHEALVFVRQVDFSTVFTVALDGTTVSIQTIDQAHASSATLVTTSNVAADLITALQNDKQIGADFTFTQYGSSIYIQKNDGADFSLRVEDGLADKGLKAIKSSIQSIEDLPGRAKAGMILKVEGDPGTSKDDFWVTYDDTGNPDQDGVWRETAAPGLIQNLDPATLPIELTFNGPILSLTAGRKPKTPFVFLHASTTHTSGFTQDTTGSTTYDGDTNLPIRTHGAGFQGTPAGLDGTTKTLHVPYDLDASLLEQGEHVEVRLLANTGSGFTTVASNFHGPGDFGTSHSFLTDVSWAANTPIQVVAYYATKQTPSSPTRQVNVTLHRQNDPNIPGIRVMTQTARRVVFDANEKYPKGCVVTVTVNGTAFAHTVTATDYELGSSVASALQALIAANANFNATLSGSIIDITPKTGEASIYASASVSIPSTLVNLPDQALTAGGLVNYTLKNTTDASSGTISANGSTWIQVSALSGGTNNTFSKGDLLDVDVAGSGFVLRQIQWNTRTVGDATSNPWPSFVNRTINEPFFYANRLGFLSGSNASLSASGDVFRFFRATVTDLLPDDPIDVTSAHQQDVIFDRALEWNNALHLFGPNSVFALSGDPALTPSTVRLDHVLSERIDTSCPPTLSGDRIVFARPGTNATRLLELYIDPYSRKARTEEITEEVPRYIPTGMEQIHASRGLGILFTRGGTNSSQLFVYSFKFSSAGPAFSAPQRSFSAWQKWDFSAAGLEILSTALLDSCLFIVSLKSGNMVTHKLELGDDPTSASPADHLPTGGTVGPSVSITLSPPFVRDSNDGVVIQGRTQARYLHVSCVSGSSFSVQVTPPVGTARTYSVAAADQKETLSVPVLSRNTESTVVISSSSATDPMNLTHLEWELFFVTRSRPQ